MFARPPGALKPENRRRKPCRHTPEGITQEIVNYLVIQFAATTRTLSEAPLKVLFQLASLCVHLGPPEVRISINNLGEQTGLTRKHTRRAIALLESRYYITVTDKGRTNHAPSNYRINLLLALRTHFNAQQLDRRQTALPFPETEEDISTTGVFRNPVRAL